MAWEIKDLDKNKLEQCIENEQNRLDEVRKTLAHCLVQYDNLVCEYDKKLNAIKDRIDKINESIENGEKFILKCNERLIFLENGEDN